MTLRFHVLALLLLPFTVHAQITIVSSFFPTVGDNFAQKSDTSSYAVPLTGANQIWDFSHLIGIDSNSMVLTAPENCLNSLDFPNADFCQTDISGNSNNFYSTTNGGLKVEGLAIRNWFFQGNYSVVNSPAEVLIPVPLSYEDSFTDSTAHSFIRPEIMPNLHQTRLTIESKSTSTVDGWGTLLLPSGPTEVLRATKIIEQKRTSEIFIDNEWVIEDQTSNQVIEINFLSQEGFNMILVQLIDPSDHSMTVRSTWYESIDFSTLPAPVADFDYEIDLSQDVTRVNLKSSASNWPNSFEWRSNGVLSGVSPSITRFFFDNTAVEICLTVTNNSGSDQICKIIDIEILPPIIASFSSMETFSNSGEYNFTDQSTSPGEIVDYSWLVDDEIVSTDQHLNHQFTTNGDHTVCLEIEDEFGQLATYCTDMNVFIGLPPEVNFSFERLTDPIQYVFSDSSSEAPTAWLWDFGDGNTSTEQNPTHLYTTDNAFTVCLTATNDFGSNENCQMIDVNVSNFEINFPADWQLFPNPVSDRLLLNFAGDIPYHGVLEIFNAVGEKIVQESIQNNIQLDTKNLTSGTYILKIINTAGKQYTSRFIKL